MLVYVVEITGCDSDGARYYVSKNSGNVETTSNPALSRIFAKASTADRNALAIEKKLLPEFPNVSAKVVTAIFILKR